MKKIILREGIGTFLLLIMPIAVCISGWRWQPDRTSFQLLLFQITKTSTFPWALLTSMLLCAWFLKCLQLRMKPAMMLVAILISVMIAGQCSKLVIKAQVKELRPYITWLENTYNINQKEFYTTTRAERGELIKHTLAGDTTIYRWLKQYWASDTDYAFPSGHTIFATSWALLGIGMLWPRRYYKTIIVLMLWATGVMVSRLALGMHWPCDLIMGTLISGVLATIATGITRKLGVPVMTFTSGDDSKITD